MKFSILIPTTPTRFRNGTLTNLLDLLEPQLTPDVEMLCLLDNKQRSIGAKRDALIQMARGDYLAFVDDDDLVHPQYVAHILEAIKWPLQQPDVVTFLQRSSINGNPYLVDFGLSHENEEARLGSNGKFVNIKRKPFHVCAWRRELVQKYRVPDTSYGEDWGWVSQFIGEAKSEVKINKVLHHYIFNSKTSEAANG